MLPSWLSLRAFQHALFATLWTFSWNIPAWLCLIFASFVSRSKDIGLRHCMLRLIRPWRKRNKNDTLCVPVLSPFSHFLTLGFSRAFLLYRLVRFSVPFHFFFPSRPFQIFEFSGFRSFFTLFVLADFRIFGLSPIFQSFRPFRFRIFGFSLIFHTYRLFQFSRFQICGSCLYFSHFCLFGFLPIVFIIIVFPFPFSNFRVFGWNRRRVGVYFSGFRVFWCVPPAAHLFYFCVFAFSGRPYTNHRNKRTRKSKSQCVCCLYVCMYACMYVCT